MATGWAHEDAILERIHDIVTDDAQSVRTGLAQRVFALERTSSAEQALQTRGEALVAVSTCIIRQAGRDTLIVHPIVHRRGGKTTQLR